MNDVYKLKKPQIRIESKNSGVPLETSLIIPPPLPSPPLRNFLGLWTLDFGIFNSLRGGGMDIFWNHTFYVYYNHSYPQNLNRWFLEKSEMINLQMPIQKNTFNVLNSCCPSKTVVSNVCLSFFGADAILAHAKAWDLVL